ncbi:hypothetical protein MSIBF_A1950006 [groundwater metagenome]|uniref:Uncharacterized protein n=1 Tax=groundwater metagenome TaxID=717931 RepID=A0A098E7W7_9ZZZZ
MVFNWIGIQSKYKLITIKIYSGKKYINKKWLKEQKQKNFTSCGFQSRTNYLMVIR